MNDHFIGLIFTTLGVLIVVPDSLFVRLIQAEPMVTAFWRGLTSGLIVLVILLAVQGLSGFQAVFKTGWAGAIYTVLIASNRCLCLSSTDWGIGCIVVSHPNAVRFETSQNPDASKSRE